MNRNLAKLFLTFSVLMSINCALCAQDFEGLYDGYQAVYLPSVKAWATGAMSDDRVVLTKKTADGTGSYSSYLTGDGKVAINLNSNFEFIKDNMLVAVDNAKLKYSKVVYDGSFKEVPLTDSELQELFPEAQIVKISQFKNNEYSVKLPLFKKGEILLVNDTDKYFHKYTFKPSSVQKTDVKGLITLPRFRKATFSLYGSNDNMLTIKAR